MKPRILLVDDEIDFLDVIGEFLTDEGYHVVTATDGPQALVALENGAYDLILSDINMPGMKGFELLRIAGERFPSVKRALITAYDVRDYLNLAQSHNIGNIVTKTTPFNFEEIGLLVRNIITGDVFGLARYVDGELTNWKIGKAPQIEGVVEQVLDRIDDEYIKRRFRLGLGETVINAFFYGGRNEEGSRKELWDFNAELPAGEEISVSIATDSMKTGIAVQDQKGRLSKKEVLYWLERNTTKQAGGLSRGIMDDHGKGMFITRETIDRVIINISPGRCTEVVLLNYRKGLYDGHQPLWIHEV